MVLTGPYNSQSWRVVVHGGYCDTVSFGTFMARVTGSCIATDSFYVTIGVAHATRTTLETSRGVDTVSDSGTYAFARTGPSDTIRATGFGPRNTLSETLVVTGGLRCDTVISSLRESDTIACFGDSISLYLGHRNASVLRVTTPYGTFAPTSDTMRAAVTSMIDTFFYLAAGYDTVIRYVVCRAAHCDSAFIRSFAAVASGSCIGYDSILVSFDVSLATAVFITDSHGTVAVDSSGHLSLPLSVADDTLTMLVIGRYNRLTERISIRGGYCDTVNFGPLTTLITGRCVETDSARVSFTIANASSVSVLTAFGTFSASDTATLTLPVTLSPDTITVTGTGPLNAQTRTVIIPAGRHCDTVRLALSAPAGPTRCIGDSIDLSITAAYATLSLVTPYGTFVPTGSTMRVALTALTNTFTLIGRGEDTVSVSVTVLAMHCDTAWIAALAASAVTGCVGHDSTHVHIVTHGASSTVLTDSSTGARYSIAGDSGTIALPFTHGRTVLLLTVTGLYNTQSREIVIYGSDCDTQRILFVSAPPDSVCLGSSFTLSWRINDSTSCEIISPEGTFMASGSSAAITPTRLGIDTIQLMFVGRYESDSFMVFATVAACDSSPHDTVVTDTTTSVASVSVVRFELCPNPAHGTVSISSDGPLGAITVTDVLGREIWRSEEATKTAIVRTDDWPQGIYLFRTKYGTRKVLKE